MKQFNATKETQMKVQLWNKAEKAHTVEAHVGIGHAKIGRPVDISFWHGNNGHRIHLTEAESVELHKQLSAIVRAVSA